MAYPPLLQHLIATLKLLPGVGTKTAERFAFHLLTWPEEQLAPFSELLASLKDQIVHCKTCYSLCSHDGCEFCDSTRRDTSLLCIVSSPKDVYAIEQTHAYQGLYHVLGSLLSPLNGRDADQINLDPLFQRLQSGSIREVIIALDSTLEGDATALFIKEKFKSMNVAISRLAFGLPIGSPLEYVDESTLFRGLLGRQAF